MGCHSTTHSGGGTWIPTSEPDSSKGSEKNAKSCPFQDPVCYVSPADSVWSRREVASRSIGPSPMVADFLSGRRPRTNCGGGQRCDSCCLFQGHMMVFYRPPFLSKWPL